MTMYSADKCVFSCHWAYLRGRLRTVQSINNLEMAAMTCNCLASLSELCDSLANTKQPYLLCTSMHQRH